MITSSSIQYITRMLNEPKSLTDADRESIDAIRKEFPYFIPARYMDAAINHKKKPFDREMMANMWLFMGNWILLNEFLASAGVQEMQPKTREKITFSLATVEAEPEVVVTHKLVPTAQEEVPPVVVQKVEEAQQEIQQTQQALPIVAAPIPVHKEQISEPVQVPEEPVATVAEEIVKHEEELHEEEVETTQIIQPLIVKDNLLKAEEAVQPLQVDEKAVAPVAEEEDNISSMYVDDDEEFAKDDDLIIRPLNYTIEHFDFNKEQITNQNGDTLILPVYTDNYFFHQGIKVSDEIPEELDHANKAHPEQTDDDKDKSLMVMMSFSEWLQHFKTKSQKEMEELEEKRALKSMWQQEKLAAANEEDTDEIPEEVFNMAVNSITKEEDLASEALAQIHRKQGKYDRAIEMYRKLSLRNPQKLAYFAHKIEELLKEKQL